jgi:Xaa-Pro aminopeptidase
MTFGKYAVDFEERVNFQRLREERLKKAKKQLSRDGLGVVAPWDPDTIRYISSHYITTPLRAAQNQLCILPRNGDPVIFIAGTVEVRHKQMPWLKGKVFPEVINPKFLRKISEVSPIIKVGADIMAEHGITNETLGLDGTTSEFLLGEAFKEVGIKTVDAKYSMVSARTIKTQDEIELLRMTCANTEPVFASITDAIRPGVRECDLIAIGMKILYESGVDHTEDFVVCSGEHTNPFDLSFTDKPIRPGELVYIDVDAAAYLGYKPCVYRTFCCGKATSEQKELYEECRAMLYTAVEAVKTGNTTEDLVRGWPESPSYWGRETWAECVPLAVGHGIGLSLHELPFFTPPMARKNPFKLAENMAIALEFWAGRPGGKDGVRLEEDILVTKDGYEVLTRFPIDEITECWV